MPDGAGCEKPLRARLSLPDYRPRFASFHLELHAPSHDDDSRISTFSTRTTSQFVNIAAATILGAPPSPVSEHVAVRGENRCDAGIHRFKLTCLENCSARLLWRTDGGGGGTHFPSG